MNPLDLKLMLLAASNILFIGIAFGSLRQSVVDLRKIVCNGLSSDVKQLLQDVAAVKAIQDRE